MWICKECKERLKPSRVSITPISHGICEYCGKIRDCYEKYIQNI